MAGHGPYEVMDIWWMSKSKTHDVYRTYEYRTAAVICADHEHAYSSSITLHCVRTEHFYEEERNMCNLFMLLLLCHKNIRRVRPLAPSTSPHLLSSPSFHLSFLIIVATQIRGHKVGSSPSCPLHTVLAFLSREDSRPFLPRRLASNCVYPRYYQ